MGYPGNCPLMPLTRVTGCGSSPCEPDPKLADPQYACMHSRPEKHPRESMPGKATHHHCKLSQPGPLRHLRMSLVWIIAGETIWRLYYCISLETKPMQSTQLTYKEPVNIFFSMNPVKLMCFFYEAYSIKLEEATVLPDAQKTT